MYQFILKFPFTETRTSNISNKLLNTVWKKRNKLSEKKIKYSTILQGGGALGYQVPPGFVQVPMMPGNPGLGAAHPNQQPAQMHQVRTF